MCFTPAFVVFLPFAPILSVWGASAFYSRKFTVELLASKGVFVGSPKVGTNAQIGGMFAAAGLASGLWAAQRRAMKTLRQTSASILQHHDLDLKDVWNTVKPSNFRQGQLQDRLGAANDSITLTLRRHAPAVLRITASGAVALLMMGTMQPLATAALAGSESTSSPPPRALPRRTTDERTKDLQDAFKREIALSKMRKQQELEQKQKLQQGDGGVR